jgi:hypothetical protein
VNGDVWQGSRWRQGWPPVVTHSLPVQIADQEGWQAYDNAEGDPAPHAAMLVACEGSATIVNPLAPDASRGWLLAPGSYGRMHGLGPVPAGRP